MGLISSHVSKDEDSGDLESSFTNYLKKIKTENKIISQENIHLIESHLKKGNIHLARSVINEALKNIVSKDEDSGDLESSFTNYFKKFKTENKIISQENIHFIESHLKKGNIHLASSVINEALKNIGNTPINIAVIGEYGTGKSSFINALRGVGPEDEGAAEVGVEWTTIERTPYKHPKNKMLILWDLPGIRTVNFSLEDYLEKVKFHEYDFFIIVSSTHFRKLDLDLVKAIRFMKKNYYFVRTKVDLDLDNEKKCKPLTFDRIKTLQQIRSIYVNAFSRNNMDVPQIFLISNSNLSDYDFPVLMDTLIKDLPAQKRHNFMLSLANITEAAFNKKCKTTQQTILSEAKKTDCLATIPAMSILKGEVKELKEKLNHYRVLFGVDDASLEVIARDSLVPVGHLKKIIKSPYLLETKERKTLKGNLLKYLEKFTSDNASRPYYKKTFYLQLLFLDTVTEDAKVVLRETYSKTCSTSHHPQLLTVMDMCSMFFLMFLTGLVAVYLFGFILGFRLEVGNNLQITF